MASFYWKAHTHAEDAWLGRPRIRACALLLAPDTVQSFLGPDAGFPLDGEHVIDG